MNSPNDPLEKGHIACLDGLRAIAIIAVVGFHGNWPGFEGGGFGVDLFFVLSGFLITWLLLKEKTRYGVISIKEFYYRRVLRIVPAYLVFLLGYALLCALVFRDLYPRLATSTLVAATYTTNIFISWFDWPILQVHTWSLSMEEQFYLLFPALILWLPRSIAIRAIVALLVFAPLWRMLIYFGSDTTYYRISMGPDTRYDSILWGCFLAFLYTDDRLRGALLGYGRRRFFVAGGVLVSLSVIIALEHRAFMSTIGYSAIALGFCLILWYFLHSEKGLPARVLTWKPIRFIGVLSYSIYLWHPPILGLASRIHHRLDPSIAEIGGQVFYFLASLLAAIISYYVVERPFLRLKATRKVIIQNTSNSPEGKLTTA